MCRVFRSRRLIVTNETNKRTTNLTKKKVQNVVYAHAICRTRSSVVLFISEFSFLIASIAFDLNDKHQLRCQEFLLFRFFTSSSDDIFFLDFFFHIFRVVWFNFSFRHFNWTIHFCVIENMKNNIRNGNRANNQFQSNQDYFLMKSRKYTKRTLG